MSSPLGAPRGGALAISFGAIGLAAGWATADFFCLSSQRESALRYALLAATPLTAAAIGGLGSRGLAAAWPKAVALIAVLTLVAGVGSGAVIAAATDSSTHVRVHGISSGFLAALAILPSFILVFFAERGVALARPGSVIGGVDRRAVAAAVAFATGFGVVVAVPTWFVSAHRPERPAPDGPVTFAVLAIATLVVVLVSDVRALLVARRAATEVLSMSPRDAESTDQPQRFVDLGVGDAWVERAIRPLGAYRGAAEVLSSIRGDALLAKRIALRAVGRDFVALVVAVQAINIAFIPGLAERVRVLLAPPLSVEAVDFEPPPAEESIGVPECDIYFAELDACMSRNPAVAAAMAKSLRDNHEAWKRAAATPAGRAALVEVCTQARDAIVQSCK